MGIFDIFRPKWKHSDRQVRLEVVRQLTSENATALGEVARGDPIAEVRRLAVERTADRDLLRDVASGDKDGSVREAAAARLAALDGERGAVDAEAQPVAKAPPPADEPALDDPAPDEPEPQPDVPEPDVPEPEPDVPEPEPDVPDTPAEEASDTPAGDEPATEEPDPDLREGPALAVDVAEKRREFEAEAAAEQLRDAQGQALRAERKALCARVEALPAHRVPNVLDAIQEAWDVLSGQASRTASEAAADVVERFETACSNARARHAALRAESDAPTPERRSAPSARSLPSRAPKRRRIGAAKVRTTIRTRSRRPSGDAGPDKS